MCGSSRLSYWRQAALFYSTLVTLIIDFNPPSYGQFSRVAGNGQSRIEREREGEGVRPEEIKYITYTHIMTQI